MHTGPPDNPPAGAPAPPAPRTQADRCPTAITLHPAADGLIARVRLPGGRLTPAQARLLSGLAAGGERGVQGAGVDTIELTGRGNLQLRGLRAEQAGPLAAALHGAGLLPSEPHDQARTIVASPLAGRLPGAISIDALVRELDDALCGEPELAALSGRFLMAIDDGTGRVDVAGADLALVAGGRGGAGLTAAGIERSLAGERLTLVVGGIAAGSVHAADAVQAVLAAAYAFLRDAAGAAWRVSELGDGGAAIRADLAAAGIVEPAAAWRAPSPAAAAATATAAPSARATSASALPPLGLGDQTDGRRFARAAAPLGRLTPAQLTAAADAAEAGRSELRIATDRTLTIPDLAPRHAEATLALLAAAGLITVPADPAFGLTACAGLGCAKTRGDVRAAAQLRSRTRRPGAPREHLVGCERRCGAPASGTTLVLGEHEAPEALAARAAAASTLESDR